MRKCSVLICAKNPAVTEVLRGILSGQADIELDSRVPDETQPDPLHGLAALPEILILVLGSRWEDNLRALGHRAVAQRPPMIVIGNAGDAQMMRRAMQAGARDFFGTPVPPADLLDAVRIIARERSSEAAGPRGRLFAVINAKGGSGASLIAANLAHAFTVARGQPVGLIDMDLQFGALPMSFDIEQRNSLLQAIAAVDQLDPMALRGYTSKHASGVEIFSAMSEQLVLPWELSAESLNRLLSLALQTYAEVVVDLPRQIDPLTSAVLAQSERVLVVMEQSLAHVRDAKRMLRVLTGSLAVPAERVMVVVNRHNDRGAVKIKDIEEALGMSGLVLLPNDFLTVSEALNTGVPLHDHQRNAPITRAIQQLAARLGQGSAATPAEAAKPRGLRQTLAGAFR